MITNFSNLAAEDCREVPPWLREVNRSTSFTSTASYSSLSSTDTSSEQGPQSLDLLTMTTLPTSSMQSMDSSHSPSSTQHSTATTSSNTSGQSASSAQSPQDVLRVSGNSPGSPAAQVHPPHQPKLEPAQMSLPHNSQLVYPGGGATNKGETSQGVGPVGAGLLQQSGMKNIVYSAGIAFIQSLSLSLSLSCLLYTSPSPRDATLSRMPSSA